MTLTFQELCSIIANAKSVRPDFWKSNPLYIKLGSDIERTNLTTEAFAVAGGPDIGIDIDAQDNAVGIEFLPS